MHDVRVALDKHQLVDLDGAEVADAADVVAAQVDQHDVLGALFFVVHHLGFESEVGGLVCAAGAGAGDGPVLDFAVVHADQQLGRGTGQLNRRLRCG